MNIKTLRSELSAKGAKWSIPDNIADDLDLDKLAAQYHLGALPVPPGMMTSRMPRMRLSAPGSPVFSLACGRQLDRFPKRGTGET